MLQWLLCVQDNISISITAISCGHKAGQIIYHYMIIFSILPYKRTIPKCWYKETVKYEKYYMKVSPGLRCKFSEKQLWSWCQCRDPNLGSPAQDSYMMTVVS
jgi:hypothetical protein